MTLAEIDPLAELTEAASSPSTHTWRWRTRRSVGRRSCCAGARSPRTTSAKSYEQSDFEENVAAIDAADHRGVIQGKDHGFTGNLGLVIGAGGGSLTLTDAVRNQGGKPANYSESAATRRSPRPAAWPRRSWKRTASRRSR